MGHPKGMTKTVPDFSFEAAAMDRGFRLIAGVDEVGRGPLAGPVTAAAVILNPDDIPEGLNDSKKLSAKRREALWGAIHEKACVCIAHASVEEIDELNILRASHLAMERAVAGLSQQADYLLIDGNQIPRGLTGPLETIVKGDARSVSISAASIVAKIARDQIMGHVMGQKDIPEQVLGHARRVESARHALAHKQRLRGVL